MCASGAYETAYAQGSISVPHVAVQALGGRLPTRIRVPPDAVLLFYLGEAATSHAAGGRDCWWTGDMRTIG